MERKKHKKIVNESVWIARTEQIESTLIDVLSCCLLKYNDKYWGKFKMEVCTDSQYHPTGKVKDPDRSNFQYRAFWSAIILIWEDWEHGEERTLIRNRTMRKKKEKYENHTYLMHEFKDTLAILRTLVLSWISDKIPWFWDIPILVEIDINANKQFESHIAYNNAQQLINSRKVQKMKKELSITFSFKWSEEFNWYAKSTADHICRWKWSFWSEYGYKE